ncbi:hypothetical protein ABFA07_009199 [Porites harrisoni]
MQSCFCPLKLGWAGCSLTCCILKLQFRLEERHKRKRETLSLPEDIQQVNSVASKYSVQPVPNEAYLDGEPPERILYAKTES